MKIIKYKFLSAEINHGTEEQPDIEQIFLDMFMPWNEVNEEIAKREAFGDYIIEDDGKEEIVIPSQEERLAKLEKAIEDIPTMIRDAIKTALNFN